MVRPVACVLLLVFLALLVSGCDDRFALAYASFGQIENTHSKASPFSVISMGRDDDDGKAKKWHIGGAD